MDVPAGYISPTHAVHRLTAAWTEASRAPGNKFGGLTKTDFDRAPDIVHAAEQMLRVALLHSELSGWAYDDSGRLLKIDLKRWFHHSGLSWIGRGEIVVSDRAPRVRAFFFEEKEFSAFEEQKRGALLPMNSAPGEGVPTTAGISPRATRKRGPKPGAGKIDNTAKLKQMAELLDTGNVRSANAAAVQVGSTPAEIDRLRKDFMAQRRKLNI
jgi:hypothetical protein